MKGSSFEENNIIVPVSTRKDDHREENEEHEDTCHEMNAIF